MPKSFDQQLAKVAGRIHRVYINDHHHRMVNGLLYYRNTADDLRRSAEIQMAANGPRRVAAMLAGMALEVLLKGIARALDNPAGKTHTLPDLADHVGIPLSEDERVLLQFLTEHVYWAGRYTAPLEPEDWIKVWEIQEQQGLRSGSLASVGRPARGLSSGTLSQLWIKLVGYFDRAHEARPESAEFR